HHHRIPKPDRPACGCLRESDDDARPPPPARKDWAPIPSLLAVAGVHHHLIREGTRTRVGLVLESGEPREVHHYSLLIGYGCGAINPYLAFETLDDLLRQGLLTRSEEHTSELQSRGHLVCRLLLEKKK